MKTSEIERAAAVARTSPSNTNTATSLAINVVRGGAAATIDEGWHAARSSGNALLPSTSGAPIRKKHVLVEHTNGLFVPQSAHEQIKKAEEMRKLGLMMTSEGKAISGAGFGQREDAKKFIIQITRIKNVIGRLVRLFGLFSFGFCAYEFSFTYADEMNRTDSVFLSNYSRFYFIEQKLMMVITISLVAFYSFPFAFELGTSRQMSDQNLAKALAQNQQIKNQKRQEGGSNPHVSSTPGVVASSSIQTGVRSVEIGVKEDVRDEPFVQQRNKFLSVMYGQQKRSPFSHFLSVQFVCYVVALASTLVITSVVEGRGKDEILQLSKGLLQRIQISQIVRVASLSIAALASLRYGI